VTDRIVNQFLCYLDGVEGRDGVFVMAATSRPDMIDPALLRPGRIDKSVYCSFPDLDERKSILSLYLQKLNFNRDANYDTFVNEFATMINGFTSADIKGVIQNAQLAKMAVILDNIKDQDEVDEVKIAEADVRDAYKKFVKGMN
jgi:peroxin-1